MKHFPSFSTFYEGQGYFTRERAGMDLIEQLFQTTSGRDFFLSVLWSLVLKLVLDHICLGKAESVF